MQMGRNLFALLQFCKRLVCLPPGTFGSHQSFVLPTLTARCINISRKLIEDRLPPVLFISSEVALVALAEEP